MKQSIDLPEGARFSCQSCGRCCQGWAVPVDQATVDRLRAHSWGADPFEPTRTAGQPYRTKLVDGRCFFLDHENRCRIHHEISYEAKPPVCRSFPLTVLEVAGNRYARLSFWCPTVVANSGKPLEHQTRWLKETATHGGHRTAPLMVSEETPISLRDFERVHQVLCGFLCKTSMPISDRLAAGSALVRRLNAAVETGEGVAVVVDRVVRAAESEGAPAGLAEETRRRGNASNGRRVMALYLLHDWRGGRLGILVRFLAVVLFSVGVSKLRSRTMSARASWRQLQCVTLNPSAASDALLTRYLRSKIESRQYVAGEMTLVTGFNLLLVAFGVINVLARMRAASSGRVSCDDEDIRMAVSAADFLVVEHRLDEGRTQIRLTQVALGNPDLGGDLLAALGGQ